MLEHGKLRDPSSAQVGGDGMRPVGASDIAVLVRTNKQVAWMRDALAAAGIGAATQGNDSVFDSEAAGELHCLLAACAHPGRSEEHTSELQSLMRSSYAVFCVQKT